MLCELAMFGMVDSLPATVVPVTFAYPPCGKVVPTVMPTESFLAAPQRKRSFCGERFQPPASRWS
jgi:hypothetical protein